MQSHGLHGGRGQGAGVMGREVYGTRAKRGREMGYPRGRMPGEIENEFCISAQYFAIKNTHRGGNHKGRGRKIQIPLTLTALACKRKASRFMT